MKHFVLPFTPEPQGGEYTLDGRDYHDLIRVRRCRTGDVLPALASNTRPFRMKICRTDKKSCVVELHSREDAVEESPGVHMVLMPALTRARAMDLTIRQGVETGAAEIWPIFTSHGQRCFRDGASLEAKVHRWERIAIEALQQCGGQSFTLLESPVSIEDALLRWEGRGPLFFLHERPLEGGCGLHRYLSDPVTNLALAVGPEGGFSPPEVRLLRGSGALPVHLGHRVLRSETAAVLSVIRERNQWRLA